MSNGSAKTTHWGIFSCGKISHDFVSSLKSLSNVEHQVVAVASRNLDQAKEFAKRHNIPKAYDSYEDLAKDSDVSVIYVGAINPMHKSLSKLAISFGKHVLCEKPLCMNVDETREVIDYAKEKNVFLMEGIWSRCFPVYERLQENLQSSAIGDVLQVILSFCTLITHKERCATKSLGGGTILDIGVYCVQLASFVFGGEKPIRILSGGHLNEDGIDESTSSTLLYSRGRTATIITHGRAKYESDAVIIGTKGIIKVPFRFWCPTELVIGDKGTETFELPVSTETFNYANSVGLSYEAQEVRNCILQGLKESPKLPLSESLSIAEIMESIRKQVGVIYEQDLPKQT